MSESRPTSRNDPAWAVALRAKLKEASRGEVQTWGVVAAFMAMIDEVIAADSESEAPITDNDRRWRFLEHGCQWVSFTPIGGDTRSFDPRIVSGYAGHLGDMRATVDSEAEKQLAILKEGINAAKR